MDLAGLEPAFGGYSPRPPILAALSAFPTVDCLSGPHLCILFAYACLQNVYEFLTLLRRRDRDQRSYAFAGKEAPGHIGQVADKFPLSHLRILIQSDTLKRYGFSLGVG